MIISIIIIIKMSGILYWQLDIMAIVCVHINISQCSSCHVYVRTCGLADLILEVCQLIANCQSILHAKISSYKVDVQ